MIGTTFSRHLLAQQKKNHIGPDLLDLLAQIGYASKVLARDINRAALVGNLGLVGEKNATGDQQKKLDVFGNDVMIGALAETNLVAAVLSEELEQVRFLACGQDAQFVVTLDPIDGSSNLDTNGSVGTIFGIYAREAGTACATAQDAMRPGRELLAAGYVMYSASTLLVYSDGDGVNGFTLDPSVGDFLLSHENIRCPERGCLYSANMGYWNSWPQGVRDLVGYYRTEDPATDRPYSLRYSGALVADLHKILMEGGVYFYPPDNGHDEGKLRLAYECAPLAFVAEQAGGKASNGAQRILDLDPESPHERQPFVIGSAREVELYEKFLRDASA